MSRCLKALAVDLGAGSGRVILGRYDGSTIKLEEMNRFANIPIKTAGVLYWDILRLFYEIKQGMGAAIKKGHANTDSIGIDSWGNDFGLLDKKGKMICNPVHYRDDRTLGMMEEVYSIVPRREVFNQTGIQLMRFNGLYQLFSLVKNKLPEMEIADKLLTIPDLLIYFLTGEKFCEFTNATTTQLFNPLKRDWAEDLIKALAIPENLFTPIVLPGTRIGNITEDLQNECSFKSIKIVSVGQHDTASAVLAVPTEFDDFVYISSGTWSLMGVEISKPIINDKTYQYNFTNEGGVFNTYRLLKNIMGLWILQECKRYWDEDEEEYSFAQLEEMAKKTQPFKCFIDPDFEDFGVTGNMPLKIRQFCVETGQNIPSAKGEFVRCIAESLALKYRYILERIEDITEKKYSTVHIVGGGAKDSMLCAFTAGCTNRKVIAGPVEATASGNILMQLAALGEIKTIKEGRQIIRNSFETIEYHPENQNAWNDAYIKFLKLFVEK